MLAPIEGGPTLAPIEGGPTLTPEEALRPGAIPEGGVVRLLAPAPSDATQGQDDGTLAAAFEALAAARVSALHLEVAGRAAPEGLASLRSLRQLHVVGPELAGLPSAIGALKQLELLRVEAFHLLSLPNSLLTLKHLRGLYVDSHHLLRLPEGLGELPSLRALGLVLRRDWVGDWGKDFLFPPRFEQPISDVMRALAAAPELELLYLGEPITTSSWSSFGGGDERTFHQLPEELGELKALKTLVLSECGLVELPGSLCLMPALERVLLRGRTHVAESGAFKGKIGLWQEQPLW